MLLHILLALFLLSLPFIFGPIRTAVKYIIFSVVVLAFYFIVYSRLELISKESEETLQSVEIILAIIILVTILTAIFAYVSEQKQFQVLEFKKKDKESFDDEKLFFKYGELIKSDIIPISAYGKTDKDILIIAEKLMEEMQYHLTKRFQKNTGLQVNIGTLRIKDEKKEVDTREFLKIEFITRRESKLTYFVNINVVGSLITINNFQYIRSKYQWYHVLAFIVTAPIHYWLWIYDWLRGKESIDSRLGRFYLENSFDLLDLNSTLKISTFAMLQEVEELAIKYDLATEELKKIITNIVNNTQNITIKKSKGVRIGRLSIKSNINGRK